MLKKIILFVSLGSIYIFTYFFKIKPNRIVFISYNTDKLEGNFKLISNFLKQKDKLEICYILTLYKKSILGNLLYLLNCIKQVYYINTSKVVILDYNNYVVSNFKKKEVKVLQVWHSSGAIKKFGNDISREYKIKNYDYVISTSEVWKNIYSSAFGVSKENVVVTGIPKNDKLFSTRAMEKLRRELIDKLPQIRGKRVILFAPTFRGDPINNIKYVGINLEYLKQKLGEEFVIIYKIHPSFGDIEITKDKDIINGNNLGLRNLFSITDYLITDYSAIVFDFSILNKPIIFYAKDLMEYKKDRGLYFNYEKEMPGPICTTEDEVIDKILNEDFNKYNIEDFNKKFFKFRDSKSTERVSNFIEELVGI